MARAWRAQKGSAGPIRTYFGRWPEARFCAALSAGRGVIRALFFRSRLSSIAFRRASIYMNLAVRVNRPE